MGAPTLPREAMWFFVAAPPVLGMLFDPSCVMDAEHLIRAMGTITTYTVVTGLGVHYGFDLVATRARSLRPLSRLPLHVLATTCIVLVSTTLLFPIIALIYPNAHYDEILSRGVIVSHLYLVIASFIAHLQRRAVEQGLRAQEERTLALEARLAVLQAQIQPHFLFNSLNLCAGLVRESPDAAESTIDQLATFLRYTLQSTERRLVPLEDEISAVSSYLEVQRQRFGERVRYEIDVDASARSQLVPPMILQPLVENAFVHGLAGHEGGGMVRITAHTNGSTLRMSVEDDGVGPGASTHTGGTNTGLKNVRERLALVFANRARLRTQRSSLGGFAAEIELEHAGA